MGDPGAPETIGAVVHGRLTSLVDELHRRTDEVRDRVPDAVHQARVTCRRIRGALATFRPVLQLDVTEPIRADLKWLAVGLGDARDAEVVRARLLRLVADEVDPEDRDKVTLRVERTLDRIEDQAAARVAEMLDAERCHALLHALDRLVARPPWTPAASRPAEPTVRERIGKELDRVDRFTDRALAAREHPATYDEAVHDLRKAVKRLRYAWEAAEPVLGATAGLAAAREATRLLGERQDMVLTGALLARLEADAAADGEPTESWAGLRRREAERAAHLASETVDMLKSGTLRAGVAVREK